MSASDNLSPVQFNWLKTTNRFHQPAEVANTKHGGYVVDGNGYGRMKWTVEYPGGAENEDYGMTSTKGEARAWAALDHAAKDREQRV